MLKASTKFIIRGLLICQIKERAKAALLKRATKRATKRKKRKNEKIQHIG
jgi:hypothetical protein